MSRMLSKMNLISVVQQLPSEDIETIQGYVEMIEEENEELEKQLEELMKTNNVLTQELTKDSNIKQEYLTTCCGIPIGDIPKLLNQQKEFVKYLNKSIETLECYKTDDEELKGYLLQRIDTFKEILSKYKEIIGENND